MPALTSAERTFVIAAALVTALGTGLVRAAARWPAWFPGFGPERAQEADSDRTGQILERVPFSGRPTLLEAQIGRVSRAINEGETRRSSRGDSAVTRAARPAPIDPNRATAEELEAVPGIGPVIAERIVRDRETRGPFRRVGDLDRVAGIGPRTLERIAPFFTIGDTTGPTR